MPGIPLDAEQRIAEFARRQGYLLDARLGFGYDGVVFSTNRQSAVKGLKYQPLYERERDVYLRLEREGVVNIRGFSLPRLLGLDDELWCIEMTIVRPPFVLDFAGAYLDKLPEYPEEVLDAWRLEKAEQFGNNWREVQAVMRAFAKMGIHLADVKPGNIEFA